jgi:YVTN family beta-propeller protein
MGRSRTALRLAACSACVFGLTALVAEPPTDAATPRHSQIDTSHTSSGQTTAFAYVTNSNSDTITVINAGGSVTGTISIPDSALDDLVFNPSGTTAYVVNGFGSSGSSVEVIDTASQLVSTNIPLDKPCSNDHVGMAVNRSGSQVYVVCQYSSSIAVINTKTDSLSKTIKVGATPYGVAFTPSGRFAYVANMLGHSVSVISAASNRVVGTIRLSASAFPMDVAFNSSGTLAYVTSGAAGNDDGTLSVINTATKRILRTMSVGSSPGSVVVNSSGTVAYVANENSNSISVVDTVTGIPITTLNDVGLPQDLAISPSGTLVFVVITSIGQSSVMVIDTATNQFVDTINTGDGSNAVAFS